MAVQELTVEAAVTGDRKLALQAFALDPLAGRGDLRATEAMADELLAATARWLPQFARHEGRLRRARGHGSAHDPEPAGRRPRGDGGLAEPAARSRRPWPWAPPTGAPSPTLARSAEVIILCVPNSPEVVEVVDGLLPGLGAGQVVVDCSTIDPDVERAQHERVAATGARYLDGPLSGGTVGAEKGTLTVMVGGEAATLDEVRPVLEAVAGLIVHVGGPGMGQVVKLCNNLIYAAQMVATAEATALAARSGVDMAKLLEVLLHSTGDCTAVRTRLPVAGVVADSPASQRLEARLHDRPDGQGPRPGPGLRGPGRGTARQHGRRPGRSSPPPRPPATAGRTSRPWPRSCCATPAWSDDPALDRPPSPGSRVRLSSWPPTTGPGG